MPGASTSHSPRSLPHSALPMFRRALLAFAVLLALPLVAGAQSVSWETLADVSVEKQGLRFLPAFGESVQALDGETVTLQGFMMPLDQSDAQTLFLLSANPTQGCYYCLPGGPETMVEVRAAEPVAFTYDPVTIRGTLEVLEDDPAGMYYRLTEARLGS